MRSDVIANAYELAQLTAESAGVHVRAALPEDYSPLVSVFEESWAHVSRPDSALLKALGYAGNTVLAAVDADGKVVGGTVGFLGWDEGVHAHSHLTAVRAHSRGHGVDHALKLFQRALCLDNGIPELRWTFDPLVQRAAILNLVKLGAVVSRYLPDFYGVLEDPSSGPDHSDRFEVRWRLDSRRTARALAKVRPPIWSARGSLDLVADFEELRREDPAAAARLRDESGRVLAEAFAAGWRPELNADGDYVFTDDPPEGR